ncbi:MAG TPA: DHH family phosphoesterase [Thermoplasmata archaeon]|nr:DHH family phosphoesterase [Thermoplasmata archaeon]
MVDALGAVDGPDDGRDVWPSLAGMLGNARRVLLVHHWDADGISTAAMLADEIERLSVSVRGFTPVIGNFFLSPEDRSAIEHGPGHDIVLVVDYALPVEDMGWLADRWPTAQIDHHLLRHDRIVQVNPVVDGADPGSYPSASWVATGYLDRDPDLLSVYGVVGDVGDRVRGMPVWPAVEAVLERHGLTLGDVQRIVDLIDSAYKVGDREGVIAAVDVVRRAAGDPSSLLNNDEWRGNLAAIDREMERLLSLPVTERAGLTVREIETRFNLISALGRSMAAEHGAALVINRGYFPDRDQIYLRRTDGVHVTRIIEAARERGYSAGGKKEVVGIVVPKEETDRALDLVYRLSGGRGAGAGT